MRKHLRCEVVSSPKWPVIVNGKLSDTAGYFLPSECLLNTYRMGNHRALNTSRHSSSETVPDMQTKQSPGENDPHTSQAKSDCVECSQKWKKYNEGTFMFAVPQDSVELRLI